VHDNPWGIVGKKQYLEHLLKQVLKALAGYNPSTEEVISLCFRRGKKI
jgi:hypothetical protein